MKRYFRIQTDINKANILHPEYLENIKQEISMLHEKMNNIIFYEDNELFNTFTVAKSHLIKSEIITTAQIEGSNINTEELELIDLNDISFEDATKITQNQLEILNTKSAINNFGQVLNEFGMSSRAFKKLHQILFDGLGTEKIKGNLIGKYKTTSNELKNKETNEVIFVPTTTDIMNEELNAFEKFINNDDLSIDQKIINSGIMHAWFERIHPFIDGNGRVGRMLIPFYLSEYGVTREPIIFLSHEFKNRQTEYYQKLQSVQDNGDYLEWIDFYLATFLKSISETNSFINNILKLNRELGESVQKSNLSFFRMNWNSVSKILIKNRVISISLLTRELQRLKENNEIGKIPSEQTIRAFMEELKNNSKYMIVSNKPLTLAITKISRRKI